MLTFDAIVHTSDIKTTTVNVPEWGGDVGIVQLSGKLRDQYETYIYNETRESGVLPRNMRAKLLSLCLVDDNGERIFSDDNIEALANKNGAVISRLFDIAQRINGLTAESVEKAEKN